MPRVPTLHLTATAAATAALLAVAAVSASPAAAARVDLEVDDVTAQAIQVRASGTAAGPHRRVVVAALVTERACPARPTAAARMARARVNRRGEWTRTIRLDAARGGLAADTPDELDSRRLRVCAWQLTRRDIDATVFATGEAHTTSVLGDIAGRLRPGAGLAGILLGLGLLVWAAVAVRAAVRRVRRNRTARPPAATPGQPPPAASEPTTAATPAAPGPGAPPEAPATRTYTRGTDGSTTWPTAPEMPAPRRLSDLLEAKLGDPRMN